MFTSFACSCVRNGRNASVPAAVLFSTFTRSRRVLNLTGTEFSRHRPPRTPTPTSWLLTSGQACRSAASHASAEPADSAGPADSGSGSGSEIGFGSLSADMSSRRSFRKASPHLRDLRHHEEDEEDVVTPRKKTVKRNTPYWYFLQCSKLINDNKLQEALDMFSRDMLQGERLQPEEFNYSVLIGGCGRAGELKKAFRLYNDMKKRGLEATDATYTALFNACAETPFKQVGLQQALKLEEELRRKNYPLSTITYHALLKTHAITNHLQACIHTLREMLQNGHVLTQKTFHYLLMGCLKDKETGFRMALQVWRQMLQSGIIPDSKNYNLLLRLARDCEFGDPALATNLFLGPDWKDERKHVPKSECKAVIDIDFLERQLFIPLDPLSDRQHGSKTSEDDFISEQESTQLIPVRQTVSVPVASTDDVTAPNLLDLFEGKRSSVISLGTVAGPSDRLALIGGGKGILDKMKASRLSPDLKTVTLLAGMMEPGHESLQLLLTVAKQHKLKLDIGFFNSVIHRAAKAGYPEAAKAVLSVMRQRNVSVNVRTFGCLALCCARQKDGLQLLKDMEEAGLRPNVHVFSVLIGQATRRLDFIYLRVLLKTMSSMDVWPNEVIIRQLEFASQYPPDYNKFDTRNNYLVQIDGFRGYYQEWLRKMPAQSAEDEQAETESAVPKTEVSDGLTESQRNQRAAARRFNSRNKDRKNSTPPPLLQHT